ncbi:MAG: hypothetical protein QM831_00935 [Kofleriaceae bacterium]
MAVRAVVFALLAGCYSPHPQGGVCETSAQCPPGLPCVGGVCGGTIEDAPGPDADLTCACQPDGSLSCASGTVTCALGCSASAPAHCEHLVPSNGIDPGLVDTVSAAIDITADTVFDTDDGSISGSLTRDPGDGVIAGIGFHALPSMGVFVVGRLHVTTNKTVTFKGGRSAVVLSASDVDLEGVIAISADTSTPGPGGGAGTIYSTLAGGCAPGGAGTSSADREDSGGGGGGGGGAGAAGGFSPGALAGVGGSPCVTEAIEPLVGGSGGGGGGPGVTAGAPGGGGGGALQISANGTLSIGGKGVIDASGGGGHGGLSDPAGVNGGAGGGGGGGGSILLEAIAVDANAQALLVANGGGGGGGANADTIGNPGQGGRRSTTTAATGGTSGGGEATNGGAGAIGTTAPTSPPDGNATANGGGGGGGSGRVRVNTQSGTMQTILASPQPTWGVVKVQ